METLLLWPEGAPHALGTGDEDRPAVTPYLVDGKHNAAIVICPGGGYGMRAEHEGAPVARWLNTLGISAFVLRYRVAPYRYPAALQDAQRALKTIRHRAEEFGIDPGRLGILGFSAGGHLASTAGVLYDQGNPDHRDPVEHQSSRPDCLILCYPVISMRDGVTHEGSKTNLLGEAPDEQLVKRLSSELQVTAETPPVFLWHTADDASVPVENSLQFAAALGRHNVPYDLHVYAHGIHGLGLAEEEPHTKSWSEACASWLQLNRFANNI
ncbi:alpha/beta hydrolase [Paenibacillus sp. MMS20-IR301]|uniref:alpha/beta hydrolase n=1 Tax=Paenibacillus sp. MMS20-IR301 TaxID=2895946 RepID=UPI0028E4521F|nr:alpha/beta hydrolase [Paenibacillus sp. MMS20-IR301]WNS44301.1 alpha/beta hydrolase [Paenibacillus sp. MMS20-IR301]